MACSGGRACAALRGETDRLEQGVEEKAPADAPHQVACRLESCRQYTEVNSRGREQVKLASRSRRKECAFIQEDERTRMQKQIQGGDGRRSLPASSSASNSYSFDPLFLKRPPFMTPSTFSRARRRATFPTPLSCSPSPPAVKAFEEGREQIAAAARASTMRPRGNGIFLEAGRRRREIFGGKR